MSQRTSSWNSHLSITLRSRHLHQQQRCQAGVRVLGLTRPGRSWFAKQLCDVGVSWCRIWVVCLAWWCNYSRHSPSIGRRTLYTNDWFIARIVAHVSRRLLVPIHPGQTWRWVGWSIECNFCHTRQQKMFLLHWYVFVLVVVWYCVNVLVKDPWHKYENNIYRWNATGNTSL